MEHRKTAITVSVVIMGTSGIVAQMLLLRELLIIFSGNELSIGVILANWLILEASGAYILGSKAEKTTARIETFALISILFSISLPLSIHAVRITRLVLGFSIGEPLGIHTIFYSSFLLLLPVSFLHGSLFIFSCNLISQNKKGSQASSIGKTYVLDTIGTLIGGFFWTWIVVPYLHSFHTAVLLGMLIVLCCLFLLFTRKYERGVYSWVMRISSVILLFIGFMSLITGASDRVEKRSIRTQWKSHELVWYENSPYGNISVIHNQGQYIFFIDGTESLITPVPDLAYVEQLAHIPLSHQPEVRDVLIISGGAGGVINELIKHPTVKSIEYTEIDPLLFELLDRFSTSLTEHELNNPKVSGKAADGRHLLETSNKSFDLIIIGISEPTDLQTNRYYTQDFFRHAKKHLSSEGLFLIGLPGSLSFSNKELKDLNSCIYTSLYAAFSYVKVFPGEGNNFFLASESLDIHSLDWSGLLENLKRNRVAGKLSMPRILEQRLNPRWQDWFSDFVEDGSNEINRDHRPIGFLYSIAYWNSLYTPEIRWLFDKIEDLRLLHLLILLLLFLMLYAVIQKVRPNLSRTSLPFSLGTTGFCGMVFNLAVIFTFQSVFGHLFSWIGLLTAFYMAGSSCGAMGMIYLIPKKRNSKKLFILLELIIGFFALLLALLLYIYLSLQTSGVSYQVLKTVFLLNSFMSGLVVGAQFPLANKLSLEKHVGFSKTAGLMYASDLIGAWIGGIVGAIILLPVLGLYNTFVFLALLKIVSCFIYSFHSGHGSYYLDTERGMK